MHQIAKNVLETYVSKNTVLTLDELNVSGHEHVSTKYSSFITLYKDGSVLASSGRVHPQKANTILELIDNTLFLLKDTRFESQKVTAELLQGCDWRVDIIETSGRRLLKSIDELDISTEGVVLISQKHNTLGVVLPKITPKITSPEQMLTTALHKAGLQDTDLAHDDYLLYGIQTQQFTSF